MLSLSSYSRIERAVSLSERGNKHDSQCAALLPFSNLRSLLSAQHSASLQEHDLPGILSIFGDDGGKSPGFALLTMWPSLTFYLHRISQDLEDAYLF